MKFRTTIILLVLVIGLGAFLLMYTARQPSASAFKEEQSRLFAGSEFHEPGASSLAGLSDLATRLELRHGDAAIELERPAEGLKREWRIVKPLSVRGRFRRRHRTPRRDRIPEGHRAGSRPEAGRPLDLKSYGLEPPERSITFGIGEKSWTLNVGATTPDRQGVYVARADAKTPVVCVAPVSLLEKASKRVNDLRDKAALRFEKAAVTRVDLVPAGRASDSQQRSDRLAPGLRRGSGRSRRGGRRAPARRARRAARGRRRLHRRRRRQPRRGVRPRQAPLQTGRPRRANQPRSSARGGRKGPSGQVLRPARRRHLRLRAR